MDRVCDGGGRAGPLEDICRNFWYERLYVRRGGGGVCVVVVRQDERAEVGVVGERPCVDIGLFLLWKGGESERGGAWRWWASIVVPGAA